MTKKSREQLEEELLMAKRDADRLALIKAASDAEKCRADKSYAPIIVKTIVYTAIGVICLAFLAALTAKVWPK